MTKTKIERLDFLSQIVIPLNEISQGQVESIYKSMINRVSNIII